MQSFPNILILSAIFLVSNEVRNDDFGLLALLVNLVALGLAVIRKIFRIREIDNRMGALCIQVDLQFSEIKRK